MYKWRKCHWQREWKWRSRVVVDDVQCSNFAQSQSRGYKTKKKAAKPTTTGNAVGNAKQCRRSRNDSFFIASTWNIRRFNIFTRNLVLFHSLTASTKQWVCAFHLVEAQAKTIREREEREKNTGVIMTPDNFEMATTFIASDNSSDFTHSFYKLNRNEWAKHDKQT